MEVFQNGHFTRELGDVLYFFDRTSCSLKISFSEASKFIALTIVAIVVDDPAVEISLIEIGDQKYINPTKEKHSELDFHEFMKIRFFERLFPLHSAFAPNLNYITIRFLNAESF
jgi:hypothetical protein